VAASQPDEPRFIENGYTLVEDPDTGAWILGLRQDARSDLKSLDERVEPPPMPPGGWPHGTLLKDGRPVVPLDPEIRRRVALSSKPLQRPLIARRRGGGRAPSGRPRGRRSSRATRAGPSDDDGGDGEGEPSPDATRPLSTRTDAASTRGESR
jgi:hypothetical protein